MKIVKKAFDKIIQAKSEEELLNIPRSLNIPVKFHYKPQKYPLFSWGIRKSELKQLQTKGIINIETGDVNIPKNNTLAKLLYAVLWKQGDAQKIRHIISGINQSKNTSYQNAVVFYQFGRYLSHTTEPIIDQHVLRAYGVYKAGTNQRKIARLRRISTISKRNDEELINNYKKWITAMSPNYPTSKKKYYRALDNVLFAIGKYIKIPKNQA